MLRTILLLITFLITFSLFSQDKIKYRKLEYTDFKKEFGFNDTALAVMDIFFEKKENAAYSQMSFLPITAALAIIPPTRVIGVFTSIVALPFFLNGTYILIKFRKKKLYTVLLNYSNNKPLPNWVKKKVDKQFAVYKEIDRAY